MARALVILAFLGLFCASVQVRCQSARICVPSTQSASALSYCNRVVSSANADGVSFSCVPGGSKYGCYRLLTTGGAEIMSATGQDAFIANKYYGLHPALAEGYPGRLNLTSYFSVALVNAAFCQGFNKTLADLRGLSSCHTGYQRTAGWDFPVGTLLAAGAMPRVSILPEVEDDAESVASFFGNVCAPRASTLTVNAPVISESGNGTQFTELCTGCPGSCNEKDPYFSYEGVVRGVIDRACDVGFTNSTAAIEYLSDGRAAQSWSTRPSTEFKLLCRTGGCAELSQFESCNVGQAPSRAILVAPQFNLSSNARLLSSIQTALRGAANNATTLKSLTNINNVTGFLLSKDTNRLDVFPVGINNFLPAATIATFDALDKLPTYLRETGNATYGRMTFCTASDAEQKFCLGLAALLNATSPGWAWRCARPAQGSCPKSVAIGETDAMMSGAAGVYRAFREHNLRAVAAEDTGKGDEATYYSVALVRADYCATPDAAQGFAGLRGKSMCSTGYGRTAGWTMPIGILAADGLVNRTTATNSSIAPDAQAVATFFGAPICAPGNSTSGPLRLSANKTSAGYAPICSACQDPAACGEKDRYADYAGVYRGVAEGACQVGFTKQNIAVDYSLGGKDAKDWAPDVNQYRLLCPTGGCVTVDAFAQCNAAKVPSRAVLVRPNFQNVRQLQRSLISLADNAEVRALVFNSNSNPKGYVFQSDVQSFIPVEVGTLQFLGNAGRAIQASEALTEIPSN